VEGKATGAAGLLIIGIPPKVDLIDFAAKMVCFHAFGEIFYMHIPL